MAPVWLTVIAWLYLSACFCCAGIIAYDLAFNRRRQPMGVMNFVFPITALYLGPFALALYWHWGRAAARTMLASMSMSPAVVSRAAVTCAGEGMMHGGQDTYQEITGAAGPDGGDEPTPPRERATPGWVTMAIEVSHCGSGCTLGDVISEFTIFGLGLTLAGLTLGAEYASDYILALAFGIIFQYFAIAPMRGLGLKDGLIAAAKAAASTWPPARCARPGGRPATAGWRHGACGATRCAWPGWASGSTPCSAAGCSTSPPAPAALARTPPACARPSLPAAAT
jgi:hypothetical protein